MRGSREGPFTRFRSGERVIDSRAVWLGLGVAVEELTQTSVNIPAKEDNGKGVARPATSRLHPRVYALLIGLAGWFALSVWSFAGAGVTDYLLFIVSGFIFIVGGVAGNFVAASGAPTPKQLATTIDSHSASGHHGTSILGRADSAVAQAALQILLPIAAAAFGMTAFGIVFHIAEQGGT